MFIEGISDSERYGLLDLKQQANVDETKHSPEILKQFEAIFLQSLLKSVRIEQHFSILTGKNHDSFQPVLDGQNTDTMSLTPAINMTTVLERQLEQMVRHSAKITDPIFNPSPVTFSPQQPTVSVTDDIDKKESGVSQSVDDFVKSIWPYARQASSLIGIDPKVLMAQVALETGWGQFIAKDLDGSSSNNLFNIKDSTGNTESSINIKTTEFVGDTPIKTEASFKKYLSVEHSLNDYISLIKNDPRYKTALANVNNPKRYIDALQSAGYATDPNYANKIFSIYHGDGLQQALERNGYAELV